MTTRTEADVPMQVGTRQRRRINLGQLWDKWGIVACLAVMILVGAAIEPDFLSLNNIQSILTESAYLGIVAAAMTIAIINGTFDLSVGGQLALVSIISLMAYGAGGTGWGIAAALAGGIACGVANSVLVTWMRVPPFVATLGMLFVFRGIGHLLTQDSPATLSYSEIDSAYAALGSTRIAQIPLPFICMCLVFIAAYLLLRHTAAGRRIVAYGSSPEAARFAGISATKVRFLVFTLLGLAVGIAVLTYITRIWTADGSTQDGFELRVLTAAILGGASLRGGKGSLVGTFAAVLLVTVLNDLLVARGVSAGGQQIVLGVVLVVALSIDGVRTKYGQRLRALFTGRRKAVQPA